MTDRRPRWTGIGSREAPLALEPVMRGIAERFTALGWVLRSGGAERSDEWFESGTTEDSREIYLPEPGWRGNQSPLYEVDEAAFELAAKYHPKWDRCSDFARRCHARNGYQVLGKGLTSPSRCVVCWTPGGEITGGTGQALRIAETYEVQTFNLYHAWALDRLDAFLKAQTS